MIIANVDADDADLLDRLTGSAVTVTLHPTWDPVHRGRLVSVTGYGITIRDNLGDTTFPFDRILTIDF